jgi:hypothetical protein
MALDAYQCAVVPISTGVVVLFKFSAGVPNVTLARAGVNVSGIGISGGGEV